MLERFYPGEYVDSTYEIDFDRLYEDGYRGVIFDIDNTLVPHGAPADERACALFAHLKELGYHCMLLSNNKEPRVKMFNDAVQFLISTRQESRIQRITEKRWNRWERMRKTHCLWEIRFSRMSTAPTARESARFW